ncbi:phage major capsid family protein [Streptococcus sp. S784/96/1]|uniref:phage major capsid family protein n=1 Tax=Streptococcus sp. S784/96/1 TaxID=2653499 RepID=UPI001386B657|nr:phage major capsid protein [Streptococcus sp. S784/96/1]
MTVLSQGKLFDPILLNKVISNVKGHSSLAKLSTQKPIPFSGSKEFIFSMDNEIDIVAENGKKGHGGISLEPIAIIPLKIEYGARVSDEFMMASEERKIEIMGDFVDGFAKKTAKGLDLMAFHGINPRTGEPSNIIGDNCFDKKVTQTVQFDEQDPDGTMGVVNNMIDGADRDVSGAALDPMFTTAMSKLKNAEGRSLYPQLAWGGKVDEINGLPVDKNKTVSATMKNDKNAAIVGDFEGMFKWGYAKEAFMKIIEYGDPDNSGTDLAGSNQIYLRVEAFIGWAIFDASSFVRVVKAG